MKWKVAVGLCALMALVAISAVAQERLDGMRGG